MSRHIVVTSNCQTGGIAAALKSIFPDDQVTPLPVTRLPAPAAGKVEVPEALADADVWITSATDHAVYGEVLSRRRASCRVLRIPVLVFSAFHPDICYVRDAVTGAFIAPRYNSAIAVWAYKNGLAIADAAKLYNAQNYRALGYFDGWAASVDVLHERFSQSDLAGAFGDFFLCVKRRGVFMHALNHPKPTALVRLAKVAGVALGGDASVLESDIEIVDSLTDNVWPIYPEIADEFSLEHRGYVWKIRGEYVDGIEAFLEHTYGNLKRQRVKPENIQLWTKNESDYNRVLGTPQGRGR